ncbi:MAG: IS1380 family transposase, partial [Thermodesulfobacteriota bacterium]
QCVLFPELFDRPLVARFDRQQGSSDGGAVLLKAADASLRLTARLAACLPDDRQRGKIRHELLELLRQRVYAIACGYPDGNDAARLADDPIHKLLVERDPIDGDPLASQPTLSRFENAIRPRHLYRMGEVLADVVIERQRRRRHGRARCITLELDPTDDPTHGGQQLTFFNGHYDTWCYLPVAAFVRFNDEPEQNLVAAVLRPGNATASLGALGILRRLLMRLYRAFPETPVLVRLDGGFATPEILDYLDAQAVGYVVAMAGNSVLKRHAEPLMKQARRRSQNTGETEHLYGECRYAAGSWSHQRRVVIKAEVVRHPGRNPKDNPRFVITNLSQNPQWVYERVYCQRGEIENRIKELHHGLEIDRTSCSSFWANQFRVLMTAAAYVLMQELRHRAAGTLCARAQVSTLRERLIKIGVRIEASVRRIVLRLPATFPYLRTWKHVACALGARAG